MPTAQIQLQQTRDHRSEDGSAHRDSAGGVWAPRLACKGTTKGTLRSSDQPSHKGPKSAIAAHLGALPTRTGQPATSRGSPKGPALQTTQSRLAHAARRVRRRPAQPRISADGPTRHQRTRAKTTPNGGTPLRCGSRCHCLDACICCLRRNCAGTIRQRRLRSPSKRVSMRSSGAAQLRTAMDLNRCAPFASGTRCR